MMYPKSRKLDAFEQKICNVTALKMAQEKRESGMSGHMEKAFSVATQWPFRENRDTVRQKP